MRNPKGRHLRRRAWGVETLEDRNLLSVAPMLYASDARDLRAAANKLTQLANPQQGTSGVPLQTHPFKAGEKGSYTVGPGRLASQNQLIHFSGAGTANLDLHTWFLMAIQTPTDPTAPIQGTANIIDRNVGQTGTELYLDLTFNPQSLFHGLPTGFTWTVDSSSAGTYSGASGSGTGQIIYFPSHKLPQHATGAGTFGVVFTGQINTLGVTNFLGFGGG